MISKEKLSKAIELTGRDDQDFSEWTSSCKNYVIDLYFQELAVVERAEIMHEALHIIEDINPFTQNDEFMECFKTTIRSLLFNVVQERVRCSGLVSY